MHCTSARADFEALYLEKWKERPQHGSITINVLHGEGGLLAVTVPLNDSMASLFTLIAQQLAAARLTNAQTTAAAGADGGVDAGTSEEITAFLTELELVKWIPGLVDLGCDKMIHLRQIQEEDMEELGMPRMHRRTLLRGLGKQLALGGDGSGLAVGRAAIVDESEGGADELVRVGSASRV